MSSDGYVTTADGVRLFYRTLGTGVKTCVVPNGSFLFDDFKGLAADRTLIFYDPRNRGRSDSVSDPAKLQRGVHHDVEDLEAVRAHFTVAKMDVIGHSYLGLVVILYAIKYPDRVNRVVAIGAAQPDAAKQYPAHLTGADATQAEVWAKVGQIRQQGGDPAEMGKKIWQEMRVLWVVNPADADRVGAGVAGLPNESIGNVMKHWTANLFPSIQALGLTPQALQKVQSPVLIIHGTRDRQSPYGGGRDWAALLPNARLLTVENAAHLPWIEAPEKVFDGIAAFLNGAWPEASEKLRE